MTPDEHERLIIRDAMKRLLAGEPLYSDGKLTIKSLAKEAKVKRWVLTLKHTDLKDEFYERVRLQNATPTAVRELRARISVIEEARAEDRAELREANEEIERLSRELAVLALENAKLARTNAELEARLVAPPSGVRPLHGRSGLAGA